MFGEQLLDMGRPVERLGQLSKLGADRGDEDIGEAAAGFLRDVGRFDFGGERALVQPLDDGAEQRFLGFEMMIERLPRQAGGHRRLLDRRAPETLPAEYQHRGIENAGAGYHLTILTKSKEMSSLGNADYGVPTYDALRAPQSYGPDLSFPAMFALKYCPIEGAFRNATTTSFGSSQYWSWTALRRTTMYRFASS